MRDERKEIRNVANTARSGVTKRQIVEVLKELCSVYERQYKNTPPINAMQRDKIVEMAKAQGITASELTEELLEEAIQKRIDEEDESDDDNDPLPGI